ncbi:MAG: GIY-YIG nuclease family protein [Bacteroidetes bacterium]|nr:GIY-YIG nuclease family protein [Bacteroidota bacterium]MCL2302466.1 GIY-YIG nuclease family protein [Lentimicrobiaceae bacterium]
MVKIGMTNRDSVEIRMKELFNTSVPLPFELEYACKVSDCEKVEKALHIAFHPYRIHAQREFFKINPEQAIAILKLLDKGSDITQDIANEINNDLTDIDKVASENFKRKMRPPLNFREMNIPIGAKLLFINDDNSAEVEVCSDRKILHNGIETSLSAVTKELLDIDYYVPPTRYWIYNGKNLNEIYNETYSAIE